MTPSMPTSRRLFAKTLLVSLGASALWFMNSLTKRAGILPENADTALTVPLAAGNGTWFYDKVIVIANAEGVAVFSSVCPHLGCRINRAESGELVCPCHGSRFNPHGEVVRGPATRSLQPLKFQLDRAAAVLHITLPHTQVHAK